MAAQRLDKIIASMGRWSRREVKDLIRQGRVTVDGVPARSAEEKADPEQAVIAVNGELLNWRRYTWVMLNKPAGYLSATEDGRGATVLDLLPQDLQRQRQHSNPERASPCSKKRLIRAAAQRFPPAL